MKEIFNQNDKFAIVNFFLAKFAIKLHRTILNFGIKHPTKLKELNLDEYFICLLATLLHIFIEISFHFKFLLDCTYVVL